MYATIHEPFVNIWKQLLHVVNPLKTTLHSMDIDNHLQSSNEVVMRSSSADMAVEFPEQNQHFINHATNINALNCIRQRDPSSSASDATADAICKVMAQIPMPSNINVPPASQISESSFGESERIETEQSGDGSANAKVLLNFNYLA